MGNRIYIPSQVLLDSHRITDRERTVQPVPESALVWIAVVRVE
jgi:hypothetical protein